MISTAHGISEYDRLVGNASPLLLKKAAGNQKKF